MKAETSCWLHEQRAKQLLCNWLLPLGRVERVGDGPGDRIWCGAITRKRPKRLEEKAASAGPCWASYGAICCAASRGAQQVSIGIPGRAERHPLTDGACEGTRRDSPVRNGALVMVLPNQHRAGVAKLLWMAGRSASHGLVQVSPVSGHTYPPLSWPEIEVPQPHNGRLPDSPRLGSWVGWLAGWLGLGVGARRARWPAGRLSRRVGSAIVCSRRNAARTKASE